MNLRAYDDVPTKLNKTRTWVNVKRKELLSREIKYRKYYNIASRYNPTTDEFSFYIIMLNEKIEDRHCYITNMDDYGRIKIKLNLIWDKTTLKYLNSDCNINISIEEEDENGEIYFLDI